MIKKPAIIAEVLTLSLSLVFVLSACGELSTPLFSPDGTYQVKALVNGNSLETCSIIRQNDKIIPYFAVSVVNDPDLTGLLVYLRNSDGDIVGDRILYTTEPPEDAVRIETPPVEKAPEDNVQTEAEDAPAGNGEEGETAMQAEPEQPKQAVDKKSSINTNTNNTKSPDKKYDAVIIIKSFQQEMPFFPLPKNLGTGQYSLVFEAVGRYNTLSLTESDIFYLGNLEFRLKDISIYLPEISDNRLIPPGVTVMLEAGLDFDSRLNPYVVWYNGRNVISEGNISEGAGKILWKAPGQSGFYSLRLEVFPYRLKRGFTGVSREIPLPVSAKASATGYFLRNGSEYPTLASAPAEPLVWYRFDGSLDEAGLAPERRFTAAAETRPRWTAVGQSYGLSAGPYDNYVLPSVIFFRKGQDNGGGVFLLNVKPVAEGPFFSVFFPAGSSVNAPALAGAPAYSGDGVWMDVTARDNAVTLRLKTRGTTVELPVNTGFTEGRGFIPVAVEFYIRPYRFEARLGLGEDFLIQSATGEIRLTDAPSGECRITLGADKTAPVGVDETKSALTYPGSAAAPATAPKAAEKAEISESSPAIAAAAATTPPAPVTAVWDEFAVLYSAAPLIPEENTGDDSLETKEQSRAAFHRIEALVENTETEDKETAFLNFIQ